MVLAFYHLSVILWETMVSFFFHILKSTYIRTYRNKNPSHVVQQPFIDEVTSRWQAGITVNFVHIVIRLSWNYFSSWEYISMNFSLSSKTSGHCSQYPVMAIKQQYINIPVGQTYWLGPWLLVSYFGHRNHVVFSHRGLPVAHVNRVLVNIKFNVAVNVNTFQLQYEIVSA